MRPRCFCSVSIPITHSSNVSRAPWNGFQIVQDTAGLAPLVITKIDYSIVDSMLTLAWNSRLGDTYAVKFSEDILDWDFELDDNVLADAEGETTTVTFDLLGVGLENFPSLFFRVEKL